MAGLKGPDRSELPQPNPGVEPLPGMAGDASAATDGSKDFPGVSLEGTPKDCSKGLNSVLPLCETEK